MDYRAAITTLTALESFTRDYRAAIENGNAPDCGEPIGIHVSFRHGTSIVLDFADGRTLSPYFNQAGADSEGDCWAENGDDCKAPGECEYGWCGSPRFEAQQDPDEWLSVMSGATDWYEWEWV